MSRSERRAALRSGYDAEAFVGRALIADGWSVLCRNWRGGGGELDLVVIRSGRLRFVEVRARSGGVVSAEESVTACKRRKLRRAAEAWALTVPETWQEMAFLLAFVDLSTDPWTIEWMDDPFDGD